MCLRYINKWVPKSLLAYSKCFLEFFKTPWFFRSLFNLFPGPFDHFVTILAHTLIFPKHKKLIKKIEIANLELSASDNSTIHFLISYLILLFWEFSAASCMHMDQLIAWGSIWSYLCFIINNCVCIYRTAKEVKHWYWRKRKKDIPWSLEL